MKGIHVYNTFWKKLCVIDEIFYKKKVVFFIVTCFLEKNSLNLPEYTKLAVDQ